MAAPKRKSSKPRKRPLLRDFLLRMRPPDRQRFAVRCGTSATYLRNVANGFRTPSAELTALIEMHSLGQVPIAELRPDLDWLLLYISEERARFAQAA